MRRKPVAKERIIAADGGGLRSRGADDSIALYNPAASTMTGEENLAEFGKERAVGEVSEKGVDGVIGLMAAGLTAGSPASGWARCQRRARPVVCGVRVLFIGELGSNEKSVVSGGPHLRTGFLNGVQTAALRCNP